MKGLNIILITIFTLLAINTFAQQERKYIRQGNKKFENGNFDKAEVLYRKAVDKKDDSYNATFNIGDALYKQEKYEDAINQFSDLANQELTKEDKAKIYHNLGNSLLQNKKIKESIEAYKHALRTNPSDMDTKYNLAYAQKLLKQQQNQQQNKNQNKDQNKDNQKNKDKENEQDKQNKNNQDKQKDQQDQQNKDKQQQQSKPEISKQNAERILQALANDEKKTQQKVKEQKAKAAKVKVVKDW